MKCLFVIVGIVFVLVSCDTDSVNNHQTNEPQHYTVTYHGNGHTSGEVPVDLNEYGDEHYTFTVLPEGVNRMELIRYNNEVLPDNFIKKDGCLFMGWSIVPYPPFSAGRGAVDFYPGDTWGIIETIPYIEKDKKIILYAVWRLWSDD
jgi:hypothetical protein